MMPCYSCGSPYGECICPKEPGYHLYQYHYLPQFAKIMNSTTFLREIGEETEAENYMAAAVTCSGIFSSSINKLASKVEVFTRVEDCWVLLTTIGES